MIITHNITNLIHNVKCGMHSILQKVVWKRPVARGPHSDLLLPGSFQGIFGEISSIEQTYITQIIRNRTYNLTGIIYYITRNITNLRHDIANITYNITNMTFNITFNTISNITFNIPFNTII